MMLRPVEIFPLVLSAVPELLRSRRRRKVFGGGSLSRLRRCSGFVEFA